MQNIEYSYGGKPDGKSVTMKAITESKNNFDKLVYCRGDNCFRYVLGSADNYKYPKYVEVKPGDPDPSFSNYRLTITTGSRAGETIKFNGSSTVVVPVNDYAMFEVENEIDYYNSEVYDVLPTGEVYAKGTHLINSADEYVSYGRYAYSISPEANTDSACTDRDFLNDTKRCNINIKFSRINTFYRLNKNDIFGQEINSKKVYSCFVDIESPTPVPPDPEKPGANGTRYRMIDTAKIFYTNNGKPLSNSNWATPIGLAAIKSIEESTALLPTEEYLQYRITLSPSQIKAIREYNDSTDKTKIYSNEVLYNCVIENDMYRKCKSVFLNELRSSNKYGTIDKNFSDGLSPHDKKKLH
jgi:hypothetical protein